TKLATDYLFLHGFPCTRSCPTQLFQGLSNRSLPYGAMQRIENLPDDLKPYEFAIEYDPIGKSDATDAAQAPLDPRGLIGSPVWRIGASGRSAVQWRAENSMLVGVVTQWRLTQNVLVATSIGGLPPYW
ncbi:MAG: hypothetical protein HUU20_26575, partial [Pirellulales bacterium]|nr:hypothetical protein [Pirellulales bacterium]